MASRRPYVKVSGLLLASLFACVSAMTPSNGVEFLFPTQGATLHYNDYVQVQYTSEFSAPWLYTFCRAASGSVSQKQTQGVAGFNSTALIKLSWSGSDTPCWFNLKPSAGAAVGKGANSDNWSFDVSERAATTAGLSSSAAATPTPTPSPTSSPTTATTASETPTETPSHASTTASSDGATATSSADSTPTSSGDSADTSSDDSTGDSLVLATSTSSAAAETSSASSAGLSTGAQIGTGIGVAIGGIFLGVAAGIWYMRRRRQKARQGAFARIEAPPSTAPASSVGEWKPPAMYSAEMPRQMPLSELQAPPPAASELHAAQPVYYELSSHTGR